mmetsp:Transcript_58987/g.149730  ORF Transcript_58987/g.149730 Transcript_58987/m.149730 type:complete len:205 (-) Transcript_58987:28-642(-)
MHIQSRDAASLDKLPCAREALACTVARGSVIAEENVHSSEVDILSDSEALQGRDGRARADGHREGALLGDRRHHQLANRSADMLGHGGIVQEHVILAAIRQLGALRRHCSIAHNVRRFPPSRPSATQATCYKAGQHRRHQAACGAMPSGTPGRPSTGQHLAAARAAHLPHRRLPRDYTGLGGHGRERGQLHGHGVQSQEPKTSC